MLNRKTCRKGTEDDAGESEIESVAVSRSTEEDDGRDQRNGYRLGEWL